MSNKKIYMQVFVMLIVIGSVQQAASQGCSDAGFCSIGTFKHTPEKGKEFKHKISIQLPVGIGDENVAVFTPALQYEVQIKKIMLQAKVTSNYASGNLGSVFGAGDVYLTGSYAFPTSGKWQLQGTGGIKLPLDKSNSSEKGMPLPQQYQSSLGTIDVITGITASNNGWSISAAWQQPLTKENKNGFLQEYWNGKPEANNYPASNRLQRKADVLLRVGKNFSANNKWQFNAGLLSIYHLGKDKYTAITPVQRVLAIDGSEGLTINITGSAWYQVSKKMRVGVAAGVPALVRDIRPDGLTRQWVLSPEISWQF
jgi:hypothetical protein